jgi:hypothetical protein
MSNGILVPVHLDDVTETIADEEVRIDVADYGLVITIGDIEIPIPENMMDYIIKNRVMTLYPMGLNSPYFSRPIAAFELSEAMLLKAQGVYEYRAGNERKEEEAQTSEEEQPG